MNFGRGSKADYDAWEELGNPGWGWDGLFPFFKKSATWTPPKEETVKKYGMTWDDSAYGDGPIQATLSDFQWQTFRKSLDGGLVQCSFSDALSAYLWKAWEDLNITGPKDHALGYAVGRYWFPASQHPVNQTRSYSRYGYYDPVKERENYHLLVGHKAIKILLADDGAVEGILVHQRDRPEDTFTVKVDKEAILAAGGVHTPQLLELSGIGPKSILEAANIEQKVDLPGVGENFQDHPQTRFVCNCSS
jgi:choline dehydrogenase-like flavoprotein